MSQHGYPERLSGRSKALQEDGLCQPTIEVLVESLTGSAFQMTVSPHDTIYVIKTKIFRVEGIPMSQQHLLYNFKELDDSASLSDYSIKDGCTLKLVLSIRGGPISTRRLPLPSVDDIQWRDIRDFVENNRDEALEWLPPGCKVLVFRDGDNVNLVKVIEDDDDEHYSTLSDYSFSDETAVTMCKMIDLRCKMEKLSMKRNKKRQSPKGKSPLDRKDVPPPLKKTSSEENLSRTINGLFDETPNFTKYRYNKLFSQRSSDDNLSCYGSIFNVDGNCSRFNNKNLFNDKFGLWPPINSFAEIANSDTGAGRTWRSSNTNCFSRESSSSFLNKGKCDGSTESFKDSILAGTLNSVSSYTSSAGKREDLDSFREPGTSKKGFLGERDDPDDLLDSQVMEQSGSAKHNSKVVTANAGASGPGGVVLETTPAPSLPLPLLTHSPNAAGSYHNEYRVAQLLGKERGVTNPDQQYYYQSGPSSQLKRAVRKVVFGSNSHLNNISEARGRKESVGAQAAGEPVAGPSHAPASLGSEPQLNNLKDLSEERVPKKTALSNSISNLFFNVQNTAKLNVPTVDRTWSSELDKAERTKYKRPTIKPGNMVFSSSTSDLLGLKRNKILPSLSRHRNCERLDVSDECLDKIDIMKHENLHFQGDNDTSFEDVSYGVNGGKLVNVDGDGGSNASSSISWTDPGFTEKVFGSGNNANSENLLRASGEIGHFGLDKLNKSHSIHNIRLMQNEDVSEESNNPSTSSAFQFGASSSSRRNLEVGSERRCRRVKKIPKLDHNNLQEHKNRLDGVSRRHFLLGYGNQGYEASIQKMPNNCCIRLGDKFDIRGYPSEEMFTPLYERCDRRVQETSQGPKPKARGDPEENHIKLMTGLKITNCPTDVIGKTTQFCDSKESGDVVLPSLVKSDGGEVRDSETKKPKRIRCAFCKKRLSVAAIHTCRCGVVFCAPHRYAEVHGCRYDYKAEGQEYLRRANPLVSAPKLPKI